MSRSITIRDVPDEVVDELAARARRSGRSMQEYVKGRLVDLSRQPDVGEFWAQVIERKERLDSRLDTDTILRAKDADKR